MLMIEMMTIVQSERWTFYGHRMSVSMIEDLCLSDVYNYCALVFCHYGNTKWTFPFVEWCLRSTEDTM